MMYCKHYESYTLQICFLWFRICLFTDIIEVMQEQIKEKKSKKTVTVTAKRVKEVESKRSQTIEKPDNEIIKPCDEKQEEKVSTNVDNLAATETRLPDTEKEKTEKAPRVDICDAFMEANTTLQSLCNRYSKILKSFKDAKDKLIELKAENKRIKDESDELKEQLEDIREKERQGRVKIHSLENQIEQHISTIEEKNKTISEKEDIIENRNSELEGRDQMIGMMNQNGSIQVEEAKNKLASALKLDYDQYLQCRDMEISAELGELFRTQIGNIFEILIKEGIDLE